MKATGLIITVTNTRATNLCGICYDINTTMSIDRQLLSYIAFAAVAIACSFVILTFGHLTLKAVRILRTV